MEFQRRSGHHRDAKQIEINPFIKKPLNWGFFINIILIFILSK